MFDIFLVVASVGLTLTIVAVLAGVAKVHNHERRIAKLEQRSMPVSKHDLRYLARQDVGEAFLFDLAEMRDKLKLATEWVEYSSRRAAHVASGGSPDDPPTKWANGDTK